MGSENRGSRFNPQNLVPTGQHSRFRYGIHFSNAPSDARRVDLETIFNDFGECRIKMEPGATHGWVGYDSVAECNRACAGMNPNALGMYICKGPYEAGPMLRPPMGRPAVGGHPMGRSAMGRPSRGIPVPFMSVPLMGGAYPRNYGPMSRVPYCPQMEYYDNDYYDYYVNPYDTMGYGYEEYEEMCPERPGRDIGPCTTCAARTSYSCERCGAFYCSEICQRSDWSTHREICDKNIPALNFGPRHRAGSADILEDRMQRLAMNDGGEDGPSSRPNKGTQEERSPGERTSPTDRHQSGDRRLEGEFKGQCRADDASGDQRSESAADRSNRFNENGFGDRRGSSESKPTERGRKENGFSDQRGGGDKRPMGERGNEAGFGDRRKEGSFDDRRGDRDRKPIGERRNEGGFGCHRGDYDRRSRNENGFGERNVDGRIGNSYGERRQGEYPNRNGSSEVRPRFGGIQNSEAVSDIAKSESSKGTGPKSENAVFTVAGSEVKANVTMSSNLNTTSSGGVSQTEVKSDLVADEGVCVDFKRNDTVVISNATSLDSIFVTPPTSAFSEDFKKVIVGIASHCKDAPVLERAPVPNEVVACQFTFDNDFYRAVMRDSLPGGEYLMQFCDYGNVQKCKIDKLKAIPDHLKKCPWNAMKMSLSGIGNVPIAGPIQKLFMDLTDQEVNLKLQFDDVISNGVVLVKPNGGSVNDEVKSLIGEAATPVKTHVPTPKMDVPAPKMDVPAPKMDVPAPKMDVPAPKMDGPASTKESMASVSSDTSSARPPSFVLSTLLTKIPVPEIEPSAKHPAEEGICVELKNDDLVVITASTGTGSTYVTRVPESKEMTQVATKLDEYCKAAPSLGREPRENEIVACQFVDKRYYRAFVSEVLPNAEYVLTFCDYGNTTICKEGCLKEVPGELKVLPRQAVQVYFRGVDPLPVTGKIGAILDKLSCEETQLKLRFSGSIENGVELIRPDGKSVNEELRAAIAPAQKPCDAPAAVSAEPAENLSPAASVQLPSGKPFTLLVFGILGEFLVAACNAEAPEIEQFERTCAPRIVEYCQKTKETECRPEPGQMCLAKFNDDWFRALTMSVEDDGARDVFFVDYGNTSKVKPSDIRKIPQEIRTELHMLTLCTIVGVPETPDVWTKIKARIESDIEQQSLALFSNVTAEKQSDSTADVTIPVFNKL